VDYALHVTHELPVPPPVRNDRKARELVRVWSHEDGPQTIILDPAVWDDAAAWGMLLVDLARHVARAVAEQRGADRAEVLARIRAGFDAEWTTPTG
jgi:hypothetical protein